MLQNRLLNDNIVEQPLFKNLRALLSNLFLIKDLEDHSTIMYVHLWPKDFNQPVHYNNFMVG